MENKFEKGQEVEVVSVLGSQEPFIGQRFEVDEYFCESVKLPCGKVVGDVVYFSPFKDSVYEQDAAMGGCPFLEHQLKRVE